MSEEEVEDVISVSTSMDYKSGLQQILKHLRTEDTIIFFRAYVRDVSKGHFFFIIQLSSIQFFVYLLAYLTVQMSIIM
jgi:hypothetical protein